MALMHDISKNRFLTEFRGKDELTLNSFLFNGHISQKHVGYKKFYNSVYSLLATLGFNIHMTGYRYLAALTVMYIAFSDYEENSAIEAVANHYGIHAKYVLPELKGVINRNTEFISSASHLLYTQLHTHDCACITDAVEIIGAIFNIYYNFTVDETELIDNEEVVIPLTRYLQDDE